MDVLEGFLQAEINTQELYEDIMSFITSYHIISDVENLKEMNI